MKYLLLLKYGPSIDGLPPMDQWAEADRDAHLAYYGRLNTELAESGELTGIQVLAGLDQMRVVTSGGAGEPVVSDGPFPESKEYLAGFWALEVKSADRVFEIAAHASSVPGPGGKPMHQPVEVREVVDGW